MEPRENNQLDDHSPQGEKATFGRLYNGEDGINWATDPKTGRRVLATPLMTRLLPLSSDTNEDKEANHG